jgi:hypothetical protein
MGGAFARHTERLFLISSLAVLVLNTLENVLHYSLGKRQRSSTWGIAIQFPRGKDLVLFLAIMIVFAVLQGLITVWIDK